MSEGLVKGPYALTRVGFEPVALQMQGIELTAEQRRPTYGHTDVFFFTSPVVAEISATILNQVFSSDRCHIRSHQEHPISARVTPSALGCRTRPHISPARSCSGVASTCIRRMALGMLVACYPCANTCLADMTGGLVCLRPMAETKPMPVR